MSRRPGPLAGVKVVEMAGMGPTPFCAMWLSDMGAEVLTIAPPPGRAPGMPLPIEKDPLWRGRARIELDLKDAEAVRSVLALLARADVLLEGFRPGVMERLGLGPQEALAANPALVYGRMTGWGQEGPLAAVAGHDPNYLSITGALHAIGPAGGAPVPPLNLVGDFGGGAMFLAAGVLAALVHARGGGGGQVVDAAIVDGALALMAPIYGMRAAGLWDDRRGQNLLDGGAPFARAYRTSDDHYVMTAAIEPKFYAALLQGLGLDADTLPSRNRRENWPLLEERFAAVFRTRTRDAWAQVFEGQDACVSPVLDMGEAPSHPHNVARQAFTGVRGAQIPAAAPRFSATPAAAVDRSGEPASALLARWGLDAASAARLGKVAP